MRRQNATNGCSAIQNRRIGKETSQSSAKT